MKKKIFLFFAIMLIGMSNCIPAKIDDEIKIKITAIQEGERRISENEWANCRLEKGKTLYVGFQASSSSKDAIFYKVFLDGIIVEPKLLDNYYSIKKTVAGSHILKVIAFSQKGTESAPLLFTFFVSDSLSQDKKENIITNKETKTQSDWLNNSFLVPSLAGLSILLLLIVVFLLFRRKPANTEYHRLQDELNEMKYAYNRVKEELNNQIDENANLRDRVKELNANINSLENANVHLVEQKDKLAESKNKLELLNTQKEELFASVIHDIKNPASAIRGYIELLNSYELNANEQQEIMQSLVESSEDIMKLSQDMCTIIAKALPEPKLKFIKSSLKEIIDDVYNQNVSYAKVKQVKFFNKSSSDIPLVNMDPEKIEEALDNLVNNAIKYAPPETIVEIRTFISDLNRKTIVIEVKDNGVGLSEDDLKKSFMKGSILSAKPTGLEQSSGLGLWLVKRIIEEHNGKVWVESKEGIGSTFAFELPCE